MDNSTTMAMLDDVIKCCMKAKETLHKDKDAFKVNVVKGRGFIECVFEDLKRDDVNLHAEVVLETTIHTPSEH